MRILFKVEAGGAYGLGHVMRSLELAAALEQLCAEVVGFVCNDDAVSQARIRAVAASYDILEIKNGSTLQQAVERAAADLLVVDQPTDLTDTIRALRQERTNLFLVALDPPVLDRAAFDVIVNLFYHGTSARPPAGEGGYYEGLEYAILRPEFLERRADRSSLRERVCDLLVCFGGTDPQQLTLKVLRTLQGEPAHEMKVHVVIGPGFTFKEEVQETARSVSADLTIYEDLQDMSRLMVGCDLGIVGGGTTLMEMCCMGCPPIVIAQNEAEMRFATYLRDRGAARYLCTAGEATEEKIRAALLGLASDWATRQRLASQAQALIDGRGRQRTAALLLREFAGKRKSVRVRHF